MLSTTEKHIILNNVYLNAKFFVLTLVIAMHYAVSLTAKLGFV